MSELAGFACRPEASPGRLVPEPESRLRDAFQRDRDRVIHSTAFRRLEYKTQVLVNFEGDHFRTRLTHSLEVAQIARTLARTLKVNEDLAEAVALAHDLGHSPFGHAGEAALAEAAAAHGGFDHNLQTFRVVTGLEQRYAAFDGLNLTIETLEGVIKHNGPLKDPVPAVIARHGLAPAMRLDLHPPLESQLAAIADDIAYCNHDLDDGLRAGFFAREDLGDLPVVGDLVRGVAQAHDDVREERLIHEFIRRLIDAMVVDLVGETRRRLEDLAPKTPDDIRNAGRMLAAFSPEMTAAVAALREFLHRRMYRHYKVNRMALKAQRLVRDLYEAFTDAPHCLPDRWRECAGEPGSRAAAEAVRDYIAGMTDRYAVDEHDRLFKLTRYHQ